MKKINLLYIVAIMLLGMMLVQPAASSSAGSVGIFQPKEVTQTFTPTAVGNNSYYIVTPQSSYGGVKYQSSLPSVFTGTSQNTGFYSTGSGTEYSPTNVISSSYTSTSMASTANPFISSQFAIPQAVQIKSTTNSPSTLTLKNAAPFSIHTDHSITFFGENGKEYYAVLQQQGNLVLDVNVQDSSATAAVSIYSNTTLIQSVSGIQRSSIPAFSNSGSYFVVIDVNGANSLVTLTPHKLQNSEYFSNNILLNSSYQYTVNQGQCYTTSSSSISGSENLFAQINLFSLPVQQNTYYQIVVDNQNLDNFNYGCFNYGSISPYLTNKTNSGTTSDPITSLTSAQIISGSLNSNSLTLYALKTGNLQLNLESVGHLNNEVTVYFRSISKPKPQTQEYPLTLNKASYVYNAYNTFTLQSPSVVAVNYTNGATNEAVSFYSFNTSTNIWNSVQTMNTHTSPRIVNGNLFTVGSTTINYNDWFYLPKGTYAILNADHVNYANLKFTVTALPINTLSGTSSKTVAITNSSVYAFAPTTTIGQLQLFNFTRPTDDNVSVRYEYAYIGMYNEFIGSTGVTTYMGNKKYTNGWQAYNSNNTQIYTNFPYSDFFLPIFIVHPYLARNSTTGATLTDYSTQLTVTTNVYSSNLYQGNILTTLPVSSTAPGVFQVSSAGFTVSSPSYVIPLVTDPNSLYNVTVYTQGNTSTYLNLTLSSLQVLGGAIFNLDTGFNDISVLNATTSLMSQLIVTQPEKAFLTLSFNRYFSNTNGTIIVKLTKITSNVLNFPNQVMNNLNTLSWNKTISSFETSDSSTLFKLAGPHAAPGFEVATLVIGLSSLPLLKKLKNKYRKS